MAVMNEHSHEKEGADAAARAQASPWITWVLVAVAVPVAYILTLPPLSLTVYTLSSRSGMPAWLEMYAMPYEWLGRNTAMEGWLLHYGAWWASMFGL